MTEILEKVSKQVKRVENIRSGSMPALDGEYYTPPVSQMKVNRVSKLGAPPSLPIFLGTGTSTGYRRIHRLMALPSGRDFGYPY